MKYVLFALCTAAVTAALLALAPAANAKSVKWSCYAPDPLMPWSMVCVGSTSRP